MSETYEVIVVLESVMQLGDPATVSLQQNLPLLLIARGLNAHRPLIITMKALWRR